MISGHSIICFAEDWGGAPTSKAHIMRLLSKRNRVLWVNSFGLRRPMVSAADLQRIVAKVRRSLGGCREVEPNIFVANPLAVPLPGVEAVERFNTLLLTAWLRRTCRRLGFARPLLWTFLPYVNRLVGRLGERMVIYHCVDENAAFTGVSRQAVITMDRQLVGRAQLVFTSSERLRDERCAMNPHTYFIPHGVDLEHFARAGDPRTEIPHELRRLPKPVVGFTGLLADWVDLDLIGSLARARPSWSFALIGKAITNLDPVRGLPNVHLFGHRPYRDLPAYCRGFDVGLIPFRMNELTMRANPLKLREYLAAGLPVVSSPLPEVVRFDGLVHLAEDGEAFLAGIESALQQRSEEGSRRRMAMMQTEGWEERTAQMCALIESRLARIVHEAS